LNFNPPETGMEKPIYKASDGGRFDIIRVSEGTPKSELRLMSEMQMPIRAKIRPEAFPTSLPMHMRKGDEPEGFWYKS
jgi:hypothetical protein